MVFTHPTQQFGDNIWIGDLPVGMEKNRLAEVFEAYGQVIECRMLPGKTAKPAAMLRFASSDMAQWVVENLHGNIPEGLDEPIICRFANAPTGKGKGSPKGGKGAAKGGENRSAPYAGGKSAKAPASQDGVQPPPQSDNIWVGDLPLGTQQDDLQLIFAAYGQIVACKMLPGRDPSAKPCAMIRFASVDMAQWIVENLNGNIPDGLAEPIICRFANSKPQTGKSNAAAEASSWKAAAAAQPWQTGATASQGNSWQAAPAAQPWQQSGRVVAATKPAAPGGLQPPPQSDNIWVGDLPMGTQQHDLQSIFEPYGQILNCKMLPGRDPSAKPCAMIRFASVDMAEWIVENLNHNIPDGLDEPIICRYANAKPSGGKSGGGAAASKGAAASRDAAVANSWTTAPASQPWQNAVAAGQGKVLLPKPIAAEGVAASGMETSSEDTFEALFLSVKGSGILGGGKAPDDCQCCIRGLPSDTTDYDLYRLFSPFGALPPGGINLMTHSDGTCKGMGFVDFSDPTAALTAVTALDGHTLFSGTVLNVSVKAANGGHGF